MIHTIYRLTLIRRRVAEEMRRELDKRLPSSFRLLRLKALDLLAKTKLEARLAAAGRA